ncbi:Uncharacterised protein [Enterobacter cloacae]|nr:Uncharacterised protein [Enterobacter cloacae]
MRHVHQLLRLFTQLLAFHIAQALNFRLQLHGLFFQLGIFLGGINKGEASHLMADQIQTVAQAFNFVLFDFFHDK